MTLDTKAWLERLRSAPLEVLGRIATASNATLLCRVADDPQGPEALAIYKPARGERPLWDFPGGTLHLREVAAYVLDRALGFDLVPETVLRHEAPYGEGSVQRFVEHDPEQHYLTLIEASSAAIDEQLEAMVVFDIIVNNADRKAGHVLLEDGGGIRVVDHGVCFHVDHKLRTVAWDLAGDPIDAELRSAAGRLAERVGDHADPLRAELTRLLRADELEAVRVRADRLAATSRYPHPRGPRPWPWPPI